MQSASLNDLSKPLGKYFIQAGIIVDTNEAEIGKINAFIIAADPFGYICFRICSRAPFSSLDTCACEIPISSAISI
jgi:hypothetical protein